MSDSGIAGIYPVEKFVEETKKDLTLIAYSWFQNSTNEDVKKLAESISANIRVNNNDLIVTLNLKKTREELASFTLSNTPGCCGILISTRTFIWYDYRRKGISYLLQDMKSYLVKKLNVGMLMATVVSSNTYEKICLVRTGWHKINSFDNPITGNSVEMWVKNRSSFVNPDYVVKTE